MDTVARPQLEVEALQFGQLGQTLGGQSLPVRPKPVVFTSTKVPGEFAGVTSWAQFRRYCFVHCTLLHGRMGGMMLRLLCSCCLT